MKEERGKEWSGKLYEKGVRHVIKLGKDVLEEYCTLGLVLYKHGKIILEESD